MVHNDWYPWLQEEWQKPYFKELAKFVHEQYAEHEVYPSKDQIYSAFEACTYENVKVVILGQDPYHEPNQAHGMAFSVTPSVPVPPSLKNIYKELHEDVGISIPNTGYLMPWAKQGVFLLNTVLTVERGKAGSHAGRGWETFTDHVIEKLNEKEEPVVFLLWGRPARSKSALVDISRHLVLEAAHPSPLSAWNGFFGCRHFSKANAFLKSHGREEIDWRL